MPTNMALSKKTIINVGKDVEKLEPSYTAGTYLKWSSYFGKVWMFLKKLYRVTI